MSTTTVSPTRVLADVIPGGLVRDGALVAGGAVLTGLAAQVSVLTPLSPVPFTGQTFAVLLVAGVLGTVRGILSMVLYLLVGLAGVPWFSGGSSGAGGASFGYILGFILAAGAVGWLADRGFTRTPVRTAVAMVVGNVMIYAIGVTWLAVSLQVGLAKALSVGLTPFLVGDAVKIVLAAALLPAAWQLVRRRG